MSGLADTDIDAGYFQYGYRCITGFCLSRAHLPPRGWKFALPPFDHKRMSPGKGLILRQMTGGTFNY